MDEARVMSGNQRGPLGGREAAYALREPAVLVDETFAAALAVHVGAAIDRIGQDVVDRGVARREPADLGLGVGLERKGQAFGEEPEPDAAGRAPLGKAVENGADGGPGRALW